MHRAELVEKTSNQKLAREFADDDDDDDDDERALSLFCLRLLHAPTNELKKRNLKRSLLPPFPVPTFGQSQSAKRKPLHGANYDCLLLCIGSIFSPAASNTAAILVAVAITIAVVAGAGAIIATFGQRCQPFPLVFPFARVNSAKKWLAASPSLFRAVSMPDLRL